MTGSSRRRGHVVLLDSTDASSACEHDAESWQGIAERLAILLELDFSGRYEPGAHYAGPLYFLPRETLLSGEGGRLGISCEAHLFGGVVPFRFVATKVITHSTLAADSRVPEGWSPDLAQVLKELVLPGISAFCREDAMAAAKRLLTDGDIRIKPAWLKGGGGQAVTVSMEQTTAVLDELDSDLLETHGIVLERNLASETTYSVGQVVCGGMVLSYVGTQRQTRNNAGHDVYGGSDLFFIKGEISRLRSIVDTPALAKAVDLARRYDEAVAKNYRPFLASRRNYDVICGRDKHGKDMCGVLEQSWRVGGASPAEIEALRMFAADPALAFVRASSHEVYGPACVPDNADVYFCGIDAAVGHLTKYSRVDGCGYSH